MKVYIEEQVREAIKMAREGVRSEDNIINSLHFIKPTIELPSDSLCINCDESKSTHNVCMDCIIKIGRQNIQIPSDDEIKKIMELDGMEFDEFDPYDVSYLGGACWMRNKIQGNEKQ
jgi:hypothetical protein